MTLERKKASQWAHPGVRVDTGVLLFPVINVSQSWREDWGTQCLGLPPFSSISRRSS